MERVCVVREGERREGVREKERVGVRGGRS